MANKHFEFGKQITQQLKKIQKDLPGNVESKRDEIKYTSSDSEVSFRANNQINEASNESPGRPMVLDRQCQTDFCEPNIFEQ